MVKNIAKATIRLESPNIESINYVIKQIKMICDTFGLKMKGPIPLPRKRLKIVTRRTPCGDGSDTYETWWKIISRRILKLEGQEKPLKNILRVKVPNDVYVKISLSN